MTNTETLEAIIHAHIKECDQRDQRNSKSFESTTNMVRGIWDTMDKNKESDTLERNRMKDDITRINMRNAYGLGAMMVALWIADHFITFISR